MDQIPWTHPWDVLPACKDLCSPSVNSVETILGENPPFGENQIAEALRFIDHHLEITRSHECLLDTVRHPTGFNGTTQIDEGVYKIKLWKEKLSLWSQKPKRTFLTFKIPLQTNTGGTLSFGQK
jgi:hypothetical protein